MKKLVYLTLILSLSGCTVAIIQGKGRSPLLLNEIKLPYEIVSKLEIEESECWNYTGVLDVYKFVDKEIEKVKGNGVINLEVKIKSTVGDFFKNLFTLGLAQCQTYQISGDIIRWKRTQSAQ
jgi:hypothetical protein